MTTGTRKPGWVHAVALLALLTCLWIGWRDFDPYVPQDVVRESIRSGIRGIAQLVVQFAIPGAIVGFLAREALLARRTKG